jgi:hypothetical protein
MGRGSDDGVHLPDGLDVITASSSTVSLINGAQECNVFWQVGSSATLGSSSTMVATSWR